MLGPGKAPPECLMRTDSTTHRILRSAAFRLTAQSLGWLMAIGLTVGSAILAKESASTPPLAVVESFGGRALESGHWASLEASRTTIEAHPLGRIEMPTEQLASTEQTFNGRPIRPARVVWMQVTAYSPGAESCAPFDDGKTATLHSVYTNAMRLVAADTRILPFGSLVSVPGYDQGRVVPVLDRGAAIKGYELDVLMPTARKARQWGVQKLPIVIWEYADGKPADDPRKFR
ncbi:MAG: 3D domain-containing protein [Salinibacterium sp.]|nr:3D domain-containing protein [Salinibacterium sp.]